MGELVEGEAKLIVVAAIRLIQDARRLEGVVEWWMSFV